MNLKRNMFSAFRTVKSNFREYICFFLALIMVETLFGIVCISFANNRAVEESIIKDAGYDYHVILTGANDNDYNTLQDAYQDCVSQNTVYFTFKRTEDGQYRITFKGNVVSARNLFMKEVLYELNDRNTTQRVGMSSTPLYRSAADQNADIPGFLAVLVLMVLLSFLLLMALFRIRINHFKFTYAVYMAFGGDFKKLLGSSFYEILLISLLSFSPAVLLSYAISSLIYLPFGQPFGFYFFSLPVMLICALIASVLALILPMRALANGMPIKHFKAEDNSNLVSSPRRSRVFLKKSVFYTEAWTLWRFRSHIAILMLSTVTFASLFNVFCYLSNVYDVQTDSETANLSFTIENSGMADDFENYVADRMEARGLSGYTLEKTASDPFASADGVNTLLPHLVISDDRVTSARYTDCPGNPGYQATESLDIRAFDEAALACFDTVYGYSYIGDPEKALTDPNAVIVSRSLANSEGNSLQPGDTVYISVGYALLSDQYDPELSTLETRMQNFLFFYKEFTVVAVVTNYADYTDMLVYLPAAKDENGVSGYAAVTEQEPDFSVFKMYLEDESDEDAVVEFVQNYIDKVGGVSMTIDFGTIEDNIREGQNYTTMILVLAFSVFAVSPLTGFFSQILFYKKREQEFDVMRAVGGTGRKLKQLFLTDAFVLSLLSGILYSALSFGLIHLVCAVINTPYVFPLLNIGNTVHTFYPEMSMTWFFFGLVLTVLFSALQVLLCAFFYMHKKKEHLAADLANGDAY